MIMIITKSLFTVYCKLKKSNSIKPNPPSNASYSNLPRIRNEQSMLLNIFSLMRNLGTDTYFKEDSSPVGNNML